MSSFTSKLIKGKLKDLKKLLKYINGTTAASNLLLSADNLLIIFFLYSKDLFCCCLVAIYPIITSIIIFINIIIHFIRMTISQSSALSINVLLIFDMDDLN